MNQLLVLFANNILPILTVAAVGYLLQRTLRFNPQPISQAIIYVLTPSLIFANLVSSQIAVSDMLRIVALALLLLTCMAGLAYLLSRLLRLPAKLAAVFILTTTFMNAGNFGLPFTNFTLGPDGLAWASLFFVTSAVTMNIAGMYIATAGTYSGRAALRKLATFPSVYAIPLAIAIRSLEIPLPLPIWRPIELLSNATIPTMLLLLGMQLATNGSTSHKGLVALSATLRLIASPLIALLLASLVGLAGVARDAGLIEAAMPTAVFIAVLAQEFDLDACFASNAIFVTTILTPLTLTPLIALITR